MKYITTEHKLSENCYLKIIKPKSSEEETKTKSLPKGWQCYLKISKYKFNNKNIVEVITSEIAKNIFLELINFELFETSSKKIDWKFHIVILLVSAFLTFSVSALVYKDVLMILKEKNILLIIYSVLFLTPINIRFIFISLLKMIFNKKIIDTVRLAIHWKKIYENYNIKTINILMDKKIFDEEKISDVKEEIIRDIRVKFFDDYDRQLLKKDCNINFKAVDD